MPDSWEKRSTHYQNKLLSQSTRLSRLCQSEILGNTSMLNDQIARTLFTAEQLENQKKETWCTADLNDMI